MTNISQGYLLYVICSPIPNKPSPTVGFWRNVFVPFLSRKKSSTIDRILRNFNLSSDLNFRLLVCYDGFLSQDLIHLIPKGFVILTSHLLLFNFY